MSVRRICLLAFLILGIAIQFSNAEDPLECDASERSESELEKTHLSLFEEKLKILMLPVNIGKGALNNITDRLGGIFGTKAPPSERKSSFSAVLDRLSKHVRAIYPGTRWCGDGNSANDDSDLGIFKETDICCRDHDNCQTNILTGATKCNLLNNGIFTRSACSCDAQFYSCLSEVKSIPEKVISSKIQMTYFNILRPQCFQCATSECREDDIDNCTKCSKLEWVDNPIYNPITG